MTEMPPGPPEFPATPPPGGEGGTPPAGGPSPGEPPAGGPPPAAPEPGAFDLVFDALSRGWNRMVELLFRGPYANVRGWLSWGLVVLLAGALGGGVGSFNGNLRGWKRHGQGWFPGGHAPAWLDPDVFRNTFSSFHAWEVALLVLAALLGVVLVLVVLWITSVFRYVLYDDVRQGKPAIAEPFRRHLSRSQGYFAFRLLLVVLGLALMAVIFLAFGATILAVVLGSEPDPARVFQLVVLVLLVLVPLALAAGLVKWFVHDLVLPLHLLREETFGRAFRRALHLLGRRPFAILLFGLARLIAGFLATVAILVLFCVTCCIWVPPLVVLTAVLVLPTVAFWPLAVVTVPLMLATWFVFRWFGASVVAPWPVFVRAWTLSFVEGLLRADEGGGS